tara:strand:+ start:98 stop:2956 length:2859 start_codon:yes stop_codon:yes gene_type:complete
MSFSTQNGKLFYNTSKETKDARGRTTATKIRRGVFRGNQLTKTFRSQLRKDIKRGRTPILPERVRNYLTQNNKIINEVTGRIINDTARNRRNLLTMPYPPADVLEGVLYPEEILDVLNQTKYLGKYVIIRDDLRQIRLRIPTEITSSWWASKRWLFMDDSDTPLFDGAEIYIATNIENKRIAQAFRNGYEHCLYVPILKKAQKELEKYPKLPYGQNNKKHATQRSRLNKIIKYCEEHKKDGGVSEKHLQEVASAINCRIIIKFPFINTEIDVKPDGKYYRKFEFWNTALNHVEPAGDNLHINTKPILQDEIKITDDILYWKEFEGEVTKAWLKDGSVLKKSSTDDSSFDAFRKKYRFLSLKSNTDISTFIEDSVCYNNSMNLHNEKKIDLNKLYQIDETKCYLQHKNTPYYRGLGVVLTDLQYKKFSLDFVKERVGFYLIENVSYPANFPEHIFRCEGRIMFSPEIIYLHDRGLTFNITAGAFGHQKEAIDINLHKYFDDEEKSYRKAIGKMNCIPKYDSFRMKAKEKEYYEHFLYLTKGIQDKSETRVYQVENDVYDIIVPREHSNHFSSITSAVLSYARIRMMEFLRQYVYLPDVIRINCDGVYLKNNKCKPKLPYRYKPIELQSSEVFFNHGEYMDYNYNTAHDRLLTNDYQQINLLKGAGGTGKTYTTAQDKSLVKKCFFTPSWKLAKYITKSYNQTALTWARLDPQYKYLEEVIERYNVWIIDEVSMMANNFKCMLINIAKENHKKIIFMGDVGFQLPPFAKGATPFTESKIDFVKEYTYSYRYRDNHIRALADSLRRMISNGVRAKRQVKLIKNNPDIRKVRFNDIKPKIQDLIITGSHKKIKEFNKKFKGGIPENSGFCNFKIHKKKWYIKTNSPKYSNTEIVIQQTKPDTECLEQYAFTIHSIQGETIDPPNYLYIDVRGMWEIEHLYTAISRARKLSQIILVV